MKKLNFSEYVYVLNEYVASINISDEDYEKLQNEEVELEDLISEYEPDYGESIAKVHDDVFYRDDYELINVEELKNENK